MGKRKLYLSELVKMDVPAYVFAEVKNIVVIMSRNFNFSRLDRLFADTVCLYKGSYPGYRPCTTHYHDLQHATDVLLAVARLLHGGHITGLRFSDSDIELALSAALLHDSGYIQTSHDDTGTGGKYTLNHVDRSIGFMSRYFADHGYEKTEYEICRDIIRCTSHTASIKAIPFISPTIEALGKMTGTADLIGQFADRVYLEKLLFLYREFKEANLDEYQSELDLLKKTVDFYEKTKVRLAEELGNMTRFMKHHFRLRWDLNRDLYAESMENNLLYLCMLMRDHEKDYRRKLQRGGVIKRLVREESKDPYSEAALPTMPSPLLSVQ